MRIVGISAFYHDSAAALIEDGRVVAAVQEERFTRKRHDAAFPAQSIKFCLAQGGIRLRDVDHVVYYEKPFLKFERLIETYLAFAPFGFSSFQKAMPIWLKEKLFQRAELSDALRALDDGFDPARLLFSEHHESHAASAFYPSPFEEAAVLVMDGVGEWSTTSVALGRGSSLTIQKEIPFPHSLGLLYSAFTYYAGFKVNSGEYKLMGLAPYGEPRYAQTILDNLIDLKDDGSFRLDMRYFDYCTGLRMTNERFHALFSGPPRRPDEPLAARHMDIAASIQAVLDEAVLRLARSVAAETGMKALCMAGGVALNCVANGRMLRDGRFERVWVQPAAGDAGGAVGAALLAYHRHLGAERRPVPRDSMQGAYLGPSYPQAEIERRLAAAGAVFDVLSEPDLLARTTAALQQGGAVGWFQGRMEFGPRALGARSILGDARNAEMQRTLNLKVKYRESFRPFAPAVLAEDMADWFDQNSESPYMLMVAEVAAAHRLPPAEGETGLFGIDRLNIPRSTIPAVTHVDYSARVQSVHADTNPRFHALLSAFKMATGCPVLVNTSFNVRGEPIVNTPEDAFRCFMGTEIDALAIGDCFLTKNRQTLDRTPFLAYRDAIAPD